MCLENVLLVSKSESNLLPFTFNKHPIFSLYQPDDETSCSTNDNLIKSPYRTNRYGKYAVITDAV